MDFNAEYRVDPPRVVFQFAMGGIEQTGGVSLDALSALSGFEVTTDQQAVTAYLSFWRLIHAAALGLRAQGQRTPFVQRQDVK